MAGQRNWAEQVAARVTGRPAPEEMAAKPVWAPWVRVVVDRAQGRTSDAETVREARTAARPPRKEWEQRLLARLGHTDQNTETDQENS